MSLPDWGGGSGGGGMKIAGLLLLTYYMYVLTAVNMTPHKYSRWLPMTSICLYW